MKRILTLLLLVVVTTISCKDDDPLYGGVHVIVNSDLNGVARNQLIVGLFDVSSDVLSTSNVLYTTSLDVDHGDFGEVLPGNYKVVMTQFGNQYVKAAQVKAGQTATISFP